MAGKGDRYRPVDQAKYKANYEAAFSQCSLHPDYHAHEYPEADCIVCRRLWREAQLRKAETQ